MFDSPFMRAQVWPLFFFHFVLLEALSAKVEVLAVARRVVFPCDSLLAHIARIAVLALLLPHLLVAHNVVVREDRLPRQQVVWLLLFFYALVAFVGVRLLQVTEWLFGVSNDHLKRAPAADKGLLLLEVHCLHLLSPELELEALVG